MCTNLLYLQVSFPLHAATQKTNDEINLCVIWNLTDCHCLRRILKTSYQFSRQVSSNFYRLLSHVMLLWHNIILESYEKCTIFICKLGCGENMFKYVIPALSWKNWRMSVCHLRFQLASETEMLTSINNERILDLVKRIMLRICCHDLHNTVEHVSFYNHYRLWNFTYRIIYTWMLNAQSVITNC
jgi:hypothetical protein